MVEDTRTLPLKWLKLLLQAMDGLVDGTAVGINQATLQVN